MSCGKPHEDPCSQILDRIYDYIDNEMPDVDCVKIRRHLEDCGPCLEKYGLERMVKALVHRACGCDETPSELRDKVLVRIQQVRVEMTVVENVSPSSVTE